MSKENSRADLDFLRRACRVDRPSGSRNIVGGVAGVDDRLIPATAREGVYP